MEIIFGLVNILQSISIALGVGCSTLAILNFFVAIKDGLIDQSERNMMGIVYIVLRVAMGLILITTLIEALMYGQIYSDNYFTPVTFGIWTTITVLYLNAILMTKHLMPSTFGPGIQAGSWYTLGLVSALITINWIDFSYLEFFGGYLSMMALAVAIVNAEMARTKKKSE